MKMMLKTQYRNRAIVQFGVTMHQIYRRTNGVRPQWQECIYTGDWHNVSDTLAARLEDAFNAMEIFSDVQLTQLREVSEKLDRVDPDSETLAAARAEVDKMGLNMLNQLAFHEERVKWWTLFARQTLEKRGLWNVMNITPLAMFQRHQQALAN